MGHRDVFEDRTGEFSEGRYEDVYKEGHAGIHNDDEIRT